MVLSENLFPVCAWSAWLCTVRARMLSVEKRVALRVYFEDGIRDRTIGRLSKSQRRATVHPRRSSIWLCWGSVLYQLNAHKRAEFIPECNGATPQFQMPRTSPPPHPSTAHSSLRQPARPRLLAPCSSGPGRQTATSTKAGISWQRHSARPSYRHKNTARVCTARNVTMRRAAPAPCGPLRLSAPRPSATRRPSHAVAEPRSRWQPALLPGWPLHPTLEARGTARALPGLCQGTATPRQAGSGRPGGSAGSLSIPLCRGCLGYLGS